MINMFKKSHGDLNQGEDVRNPQAMIERKKTKLANRMNQQRGEDRKNGKSGYENSRSADKFTGGRAYSNKAKQKIIAKS